MYKNNIYVLGHTVYKGVICNINNMKRWRRSYIGAEFLYAIEVKLKLIKIS